MSANGRTNSWLIRRDVLGHVIVVTANYIRGLDSWGMSCKVDGELTDHRQADRPVEEAMKMVEIAVNNIEAAEFEQQEGNGAAA